MSLDVSLIKLKPTEVYSGNITHNLRDMAKEAGLYEPLWRPEEIGVTHAWQLIPLLAAGLSSLIDEPEKYKKHNPINGWGNYEIFAEFVRDYLKACRENPEASVEVWR